MKRAHVIVYLILLVLIIVACSDSSSTTPIDLPDDHTVDNGGILHRPGFSDPLTNCTPCHGDNLTGGEISPVSCFFCHNSQELGINDNDPTIGF